MAAHDAVEPMPIFRGIRTQTNVVETHISRLRAKVDKPFDADLIKTVRGVGYRIEE
jgi:DNA-binding response OmpR family regulator